MLKDLLDVHVGHHRDQRLTNRLLILLGASCQLSEDVGKLILEGGLHVQRRSVASQQGFDVGPLCRLLDEV